MNKGLAIKIENEKDNEEVQNILFSHNIFWNDSTKRVIPLTDILTRYDEEHDYVYILISYSNTYDELVITHSSKYKTDGGTIYDIDCKLIDIEGLKKLASIDEEIDKLYEQY